MPQFRHAVQGSPAKNKNEQDSTGGGVSPHPMLKNRRPVKSVPFYFPQIFGVKHEHNSSLTEPRIRPTFFCFTEFFTFADANS